MKLWRYLVLEETRNRKRKTKLLPWESSELTVLKEMLDKLLKEVLDFEKLSTKQKLNRMVAIIKFFTEPFSLRPIPSEILLILWNKQLC